MNTRIRWLGLLEDDQRGNAPLTDDDFASALALPVWGVDAILDQRETARMIHRRFRSRVVLLVAMLGAVEPHL